MHLFIVTMLPSLVPRVEALPVNQASTAIAPQHIKELHSEGHGDEMEALSVSYSYMIPEYTDVQLCSNDTDCPPIATNRSGACVYDKNVDDMSKGKFAGKRGTCESGASGIICDVSRHCLSNFCMQTYVKTYNRFTLHMEYTMIHKVCSEYPKGANSTTQAVAYHNAKAANDICQTRVGCSVGVADRCLPGGCACSLTSASCASGYHCVTTDSQEGGFWKNNMISQFYENLWSDMTKGQRYCLPYTKWQKIENIIGGVILGLAVSAGGSAVGFATEGIEEGAAVRTRSWDAP